MQELYSEKAIIDTHSRLDYSHVESDRVDLSSYWQTLKRTKWTIVVSTIFCLLVGVIIAFETVPAYKASSKILADPKEPNTSLNQKNVSSVVAQLFYQTQYEIIQSRRLAETVVDKLGLVERYKNKDSNVREESWQSLSAKIIAKFPILKRDKDEVTAPINDNELRIKIASGIQENLSVMGGKQSQIIDVSYTSRDPKKAAEVVNAIAEAYIQFGLETRLSEAKNTEAWLGEQSAQLKATLLKAEARLSEFRTTQNLVDTQQQQKLVNTQLQSLNNELIGAQTRLIVAEEKYVSIKDIKVGSPNLYSVGAVLQNRTASGMVIEQARLSQRVNELFERYGEKHPVMIAARSELKSATNNLEAEVRKVVENIEREYRLAQNQVANIEKLIAQNRKNIQGLQTENFSLVSLERDVENNRRIYENFQFNLVQASGVSEYTASNVHIIDSATIPEEPFKPNISSTILISIIMGVLLGGMIGFTREALDNTFNTTDTIEEKLFLSALGIMPIVKKKRNSATPEKQYFDDSRSPFSESINVIRTGLLFANIDNPPKTFLVTSAIGNEGKSTLAINLAAAFSSIGKTLLLEVDLRKPSLATSLNIEPALGLTDLITGAVGSFEDIVHQQNNENLSVIPSGKIIHNPLELLSSKKFEALLQLLKRHYEFIILDGPPTMPVIDSCMLANRVDGVIFAVKAQDTKVNVAKEAISRLKRLNANVIGAVLTSADPHKMSYYGEQFDTGAYYGIKPEKDSGSTSTSV